jgi:alanine racemase
MKASSPDALAQACGAKLIQGDGNSLSIRHVLFDSRRVFQASESLFVALVTARNNGHQYIEEVYQKGVRCFLVEEVPSFNGHQECDFLVVDDTLEALQMLAKSIRKEFQAEVVGLTGSNGKTIVKEWLYSILHTEKTVYRSPKSYNSQLGVALSLCHLEPEAELAIIEAGISKPGEMATLEKMIHPRSGIFTNIGNAHQENFTSRAEKLAEKLKLFEHSELLVYCRDHEELHHSISEHFRGKTFTWGLHEEAQLNIRKSAHTASFEYALGAKRGWLNLPFEDVASVENALHCFAWIAATDQMPLEKAAEALQHLQPPEMRLEMLPALNQSTLINDAWIVDLDSLKMALNTMVLQTHYARRTIILSDIPSSNEGAELLYGQVKALLTEAGVTRLLGIGQDIEKYLHEFEGERRFYPNTESFLAALPSLVFQQECILLKGARRFGFERIASQLARQTHETVLKINLSNLLHNVAYYRQQIAPGTKLMAMVKAFSYGSGHSEVASLLQNHGIDYLAVAFADEGLELRRAGVKLPIMVMSPEKTSISQMLDAGLEPEVYSFSLLEEFCKVLSQRSGYDQMPLRIHLKLNTGMNRLGFDREEWEKLAMFVQNKPEIEVATVFSHLAASGEAEHDAFTQEQIALFEQGLHILRQAVRAPFIAHLANSAAIRRHPNARFDMVRLGIGMYGIGSPEEQAYLLPVASLETSITQIRVVRKESTVGYSRRGKLQRDSRIATLPIGYADGFLRKLGNRRFEVMIHGKLAPVIGSVCMDMCMVDVTEIPEAREGDKVIIFNSAERIIQMAETLETIPYEVLTGISQRVKRVYFQD